MCGLLKTVRSGFFVRSNDGINDFSLLRFVTVLLLQDFVWQGQKPCTRLALYFEFILVNSLNKSDVYIYSFDESFNEITQTLEIG